MFRRHGAARERFAVGLRLFAGEPPARGPLR